jgi:hypothetical protein
VIKGREVRRVRKAGKVGKVGIVEKARVLQTETGPFYSRPHRYLPLMFRL